MNDFDVKEWRREMERAIDRAEPIPIRVLLDQLEASIENMQALIEDFTSGDME